MFNYPNPFIESSFVSFRLKEASFVTLQIFNITGEQMATLINEELYSKGKHVMKIDARSLGLSPGVYFVKLFTGQDQITTRILLVGK
jgi:hypothetical protein